jgi:hypothetical protein
MRCIVNKQLFPNVIPIISGILGYWNMLLVCCLGWPHWWLPLLRFVSWRDVMLTQRTKAENTVETVDGYLSPQLVTRDVMVQVPGDGVPCVWFLRCTLYLQAVLYTKWLLQYRIIPYRFSDCNWLYWWNDGLWGFFVLYTLPETCSLHPSPLTLWTSSLPSS